MRTIHLLPEKKIYFASDQHFGLPNSEQSKKREEKFIRWLDEIKKDAQVIFLMGDLFDFWHEWKTVVPKGYIRVLAKLAELSDAGVKLYFFVGNHDLWMKSYLKEEIGCEEIFFEKQYFNINGTRFLLAHGDGLGPGDYGYKRMKRVFTHPLAQWLFKWIHPDISMRIAHYLSQKNKLISGAEDVHFLGEDKEYLILYAKEKLKTEPINYFIFGHRHLPLALQLNDTAMYINLGDWIDYFTYGVFQEDFELKYFEH